MVAAGVTDCAKTPRQPATLEKRPPQFRYGAFSLAARGPRTLFSFFQNAISEFSHSLSRRRLPFHRGFNQLFFRCASAPPRPVLAHGESAPPVRFVLWQQNARRSHRLGTLVSVRSR